MKNSVFLILLLLFSSGLIEAQVQWPVITQTAKPWTRWWWQGSAVNAKDLTAAMQQYQAAGLGGLEITPIYGVKGAEDKFINFLSPKWIEMLQHTLGEGQRLGLGIDMANATGWPFGGPWVTPADACRNINLKTYQLHEGQQLQDPIRFMQQAFYRSESKAKPVMKDILYPIAANKGLQAYAFDQFRYAMILKPGNVLAYNERNEMVDLTSKVDTAGILHWTAPPGNWKLYALFTGWHGKMVERAAPGGEGDVIDHFSAPALEHYLQKFTDVFHGKDISGIRAFFNDSYEVDDAKGQSNWTPGFLNQFRTRRGYALEPYIPALLDRDSTDTGRRILSDYRQTISDLLLDNFTRPWHAWASAMHKSLRNQSHGSPANILDLYGVVDIPETEGSDVLRFKFATSTAHVMGKRLASSETATWLNEHFRSSLGDVKQAVDKYFIGGVNHVFWHGTNYSPQDEPWPGWLFYAAVHFTPANSFWRDFSALNHYVARCQSFLQQGKPDNDVLLYFPFYDRIAGMGRDLLLHFDGMEGFDKTVFKTSAEWMMNAGYAFDLISDKQVLGLRNSGNSLQTGDVTYRTILLADVTYLPLETLRKLRQSAEAGATIIFFRHLPADVPGLAELSRRHSEMSEIIRDLHFTTVNSTVKKAVIGRGCFLMGENLQDLFREARIRRESLVDTGLQYVRRSTADGHTYFISNNQKTAYHGWVSLQVPEKYIMLYDPMTLTAGVAKTRMNDGALQVLLQLEPGGSCIVTSSGKVSKDRSYPYYILAKETIPVTGTWQVRFTNGGPVLPGNTQSTTLDSWTNWQMKAVENFSGTAQYSIRFTKPGNANFYQLDLGKVEESAEVILNGNKIATLIGPSFKVMLPASAMQNENLLQVNVTNGMSNRIADLDRRGINWKKFYNTNFPARLPQNRGADGIFTAAGWQPAASGLLGPVTVTAASLLK